ncbi:hypothetical protein [Desmospora profundinema]|uniref:Uncharacterized protein n=1 Tax=Desmospora profundinema TaxID=1571184 RepID=A0ABU1IIY3_9BACL|nr:hypothetical protein [Desmospora profundinema]MDR6224730.1 hypothetical protein [Desmospora profundinema]
MMWIRSLVAIFIDDLNSGECASKLSDSFAGNEKYWGVPLEDLPSQK